MKWLVFTSLYISGGLAMASNIVVIAKDIRLEKGGSVIFFLYSIDGFPKDHSKALSKKTVKANSSQLSIEFENVPDEFAIKVLHDEDEDGEVTKNWTGIVPKEGLGFSNGQWLKLTGPPGYSACKLKRESVVNPIEIKIRYP